MTDAATNAWLVRVPRFLKEAWAGVDQDDVNLGFVRVYDADHRGHQRMELHLPETKGPSVPGVPASSDFPRRFDLRMAVDHATGQVRSTRNTWAFKEWEEEGDAYDSDEDILDSHGDLVQLTGEGRRTRRRTAVTGTVTNEVHATPQARAAPAASSSKYNTASSGMTPEYRALLKKRKEASKTQDRTQMLDETDTARNNMLAAGVQGFGTRNPANFVTVAAKPTSTDKFARLPRNELLDMLMQAFEKYKYWSTKGLREHTKQPEIYLKEVLSTVADFHKRGPYAKNWSLKPEYANVRPQTTAQASSSTAAAAVTSGGWGLSPGDLAAQTSHNNEPGGLSGEEGNNDSEDDGEDFEDIV
ncbi:hypothetical protein IE81DRAFT_320501 [Ceraceosorus guamensis]|uniref:Transcription initiation factor IIF subunit beta n=1 Tax=Ceraceosorus guamensis TaxID=1522189 RepID=A0A316WBK2_9BASI|nr:hypothetical protein IE81DRAFT_320501 [Ceraceosorus guamensis]PWN45313.1 hypothetical protein IE81DRAFT_320501 [Ceraceosorus guamensis]